MSATNIQTLCNMRELRQEEEASIAGSRLLISGGELYGYERPDVFEVKAVYTKS